mgnify:CR=1 FL=1
MVRAAGAGEIGEWNHATHPANRNAPHNALHPPLI